MRDRPAAGEKPVIWVGSAKRDLLGFPLVVMREVGVALGVAQYGDTHPSAKAAKGEGPGVFEVVQDFDRGTYRAVYTVQFRAAIYVLHCFQKKSPSGVRTAKQDVELIGKRLKDARQHYERQHGKGAK